MKYSFLILAFFLLASNWSVTAQSSVNDFKYVLVPNRYEWTKSADQYQVNSLTEFLFEKYGFDAYILGKKLPVDLNTGDCNTLTTSVTERNSIIYTRLTVTLKDCDGEVVFVSEEGKSKEKDYKKAYHEALRSAFYSIEALKYQYNSKSDVVVPATNNDTSIEPSNKRGETEVNAVSTEVSKSQEVQEQVDKVIANDVIPNEVITEEPEIKKMEKISFKSEDGAYLLNMVNDKIIVREENLVIGSGIKNDDNTYTVETTEFSGKGYLENEEQFIIERQIKGIQGVVKMIFIKE